MKERFRRWRRKNPYLPAILLGILLFLTAQGLILYNAFFPFIDCDEEALLQVLGICVQVIAGLYGITLTGYIFFLGQLQQEAAGNEDLTDVIQLLRQRYNQLVLLITGSTLLCLFSGCILILYSGSTALSDAVHRLWNTETLLFMAGSVVLIFYFICDVVDPNKFAKISEKNKARLDGPSPASGSVQEFLADCDAIQRLIFAQLPYQSKNQKPTLAGALRQARSYMDPELWRKIDRLTKYYGYLMCSRELTVSEEMCALAREVLEVLRRLLPQG